MTRTIRTTLAALGAVVALLLGIGLAAPAQAAPVRNWSGYEMSFSVHWASSSGCGGTCYTPDIAWAGNARANSYIDSMTTRYGANGQPNLGNAGIDPAGTPDAVQIDDLDGTFTTWISGASSPYVVVSVNRRIGSSSYQVISVTMYLSGTNVVNSP